MSRTLYACAWAADFPVQAMLRLRTDWQTEPVVVLDGRAPAEWVCSLNKLAARMGAEAGISRLEAESMSGLRLLKRSAENEAAARAVFLECVAKFSPRIEDVFAGDSTKKPTAEPRRPVACAYVLDIAGTERLFGSPAQLAERLRDELAASGFRASVAVSANYDAARIKAASIRGISVISESAEAAALAKLPITALDLDEEHAATFALWGIHTLGDLAALPEAELVARVGPQARLWRALARGEAEHAFVPIEAGFALDEFSEFESPVEQIESLLFVGARMIDCLVSRAVGRALAVRAFMVEMVLDGGGTHRVTIRPAVATTDRKFLLKLMQLEIGAIPPKAAVVSLAVRAEAGQQSKVQLGLFAPQTPEPSRLDVTLARLRAMVGDERVGSPILEDTHDADGFHMEAFAIPECRNEIRRSRGAGDAHMETCPRMALRRVRPPRLVRVMLFPAFPASFSGKDAGKMGQPMRKPTAFSDGENRYEIAAAYGPWRMSGCWWAMDAWNCEEWDVLATANDGATVACLLSRDCARNAWRLEAFYD